MRSRPDPTLAEDTEHSLHPAMNCPSCSHDNRPGRKFCVSCGVALPRACPGCGAECEAGENFCGECGEPLAAAPSPRPRAELPRPEPAPVPPAAASSARKVVTIVFADLAGSTALHERVDAESARRLMERYYLALRRAVETHGGTVVKLLGDGVMAAFGLHQVSEDDALRAVRAAAAMQEAFRALVSAAGEALGAVGLRVAVNTGEVVVAAGEDDVVGDPVNVAARLQEQAHNGDVVLGEATRRLVSTRVTLEALGTVSLKGRAEAVAAHRLVSLDPPAGPVASPFVGRDAELARLERVFDDATTTPATRLAVLVGSPGLGKSRLIDELCRRRADDATLLAAHCDAAGGATFAPLAQALRSLLGLADGVTGEPLRVALEAALDGGDGSGDGAERTRIAAGIDGLLTGAATSPEETFFVVRRFLAALAAARAVVLVIDDLQWAEPLLLDLVEHLVQWGSGVPLFVLVGARPELRDLRSSLVMPGGAASDVVTLGGLDAGAAMRLAAGMIGAADLPAAVAAKVLATSEGNPLFVGELVRMLVQEGALARDGDRWTAGAALAALEMPPTIHALLAARIERLRPEERRVLERAAVIGRHFSRGAVAALLGGDGHGPGDIDAGELDSRLEALRRSELIERDSGWFLGEPALRFHHVLIRDAAYRRLLKGTRAALHSQLADWLEGRFGDAPDQDETIGRHLEQACQLLRELEPNDPSAIPLGERASRRLAAGGRRALARDDVTLAAGLLGRALALLDARAPERADLVLDRCEALLAAGEVGPAADVIAELDRLATPVPDAARSGRAAVPPASQDEPPAGSGIAGASDVAAELRRLRAWHTCFDGQLTVLTAPEDLHATAGRVGAAAGELAALGDAAGEAKAHFVHAQALARLGTIGASEAALDLALAAARRAGDRRRANAVLAGAPLAALWGPSPVTRASGRCLDVVRVLRITQGAPAVEAVALSCQGVLEAMRGRIDAARRMLASSRTMVEELGIAHRLHETDVFAGRIDLLEGDAPAAERALRRGFEGLRDLGLGIDAARAAALLGRALLAQDRAAEGEALSHESERLAGDDLQAAIAWRGVRAEALARRGDHADAIALAEAAVAIAEATDALLDHADARLALAAALRAGGRRAEADAEERRAVDLWEAKGATLLAERAGRGTPLATAPAAQPASSRRFTPNSASRAIRKSNVATPEDFRRLSRRVAETYVETDHQTEVTYGRDGAIASMERHMRSADAVLDYDPVATLGDALVLCRRTVSASATRGKHFDVGAYEHHTWTVIEFDHAGRMLRQEVFADDRLADAIVRLYDRHAQLLPDGPERTRAARTAESHAVFYSTDTDNSRWLATLAPDLESIDHRQMSTWAARGADAFAAHMRALHEVAEAVEFRVVDLLALDPNVQLQRVLHAGTDRASGGAYERSFLRLVATGPEGLRTRIEWFDDDREDEALARFDALVPGDATPGVSRRTLQPNAATATLARFRAAELARDLDALERTMSPEIEVVHHATGTTYGLKGMLATWRSMFRATKMERRQEEIAALGGDLALGRHTISIEGLAEKHLAAFGSAEIDEVVLTEVDGAGRIRRFELFPTERLGAAVVRLYQLYAEGDADPACARRARGIAASLTAFEGSLDFERLAAAHRSDVEVLDHRVLGTWSARGRADGTHHWQGFFGLADDMGARHEEILDLGPGTILSHLVYSGTNRTSGERFEIVSVTLNAFDDDGLIARTEVFDPEDKATALARYDELASGEPARQGAPREAAEPRATALNRACSMVHAFEVAFAAADHDALAALFDASLVVVDHPNAANYGLDGHLASLARLLRADDPELRAQPIATLGDDLVLWRRRIRAGGTSGGRFDVGEFQREELVIFALGEGGAATTTVTRIEVCARDRLGQALARLYELHAASLPEGPQRSRVDGVARCFPNPGAPPVELESLLLDQFAQAFVCVDHRSLRTWSAGNWSEWAEHVRTQYQLSSDVFGRVEEVLAHTPFVMLARRTFGGTIVASGGAFENAYLCIDVYDEDGRVARMELFESDQEAAALARFDELAGPSPLFAGHEAETQPFANAATRAVARLARATQARDWEELADTVSADLLFDDRRALLRMQLDREGFLQQHRVLFDAPNARWSMTTVATRGERLSLSRIHFFGNAAEGGGELEIEHLGVLEADDDGRMRVIVLFEPSDLAAARAELDARWQAGGEAAAHPVAARFSAASHRLLEVRDWETLASLFAPTLAARDHRLVGWGDLRGPEAFVGTTRAMVDLAPDAQGRLDHQRVSGRALLAQVVWTGTRDGGAFESPFLWVVEFDATGLARRLDFHDLRHFEKAHSRFAEIAAQPSAPPAAGAPDGGPRGSDPILALLRPNLATEAMDRWLAEYDRCFENGEWEAMRPLVAPGYEFHDRRRLALLDGGVDLLLDASRERASIGARMQTTVLGAFGNRVAAERILWSGGPDDGRFEIEYIGVIEADETGRLLCQAMFDVDDAPIARRYAVERWSRIDDVAAIDAAFAGLEDCFNAKNVAGLRAVMTEDVVFDDRRRTGVGLVEGIDAYAPTVKALWELAPDARVETGWAWLAYAPEGGVSAFRRSGSLPDGGEYVSDFLGLVLLDHGRVARFELWEIDAADAAVARFDELLAALRGQG